ncbi:MAG: glycoside hydrolase family 2 TIM barrel-domain containing protein [Prolixibacteraceae bacterium]
MEKKLIHIIILFLLSGIFVNGNALQAQVLIPQKEGNRNVQLLNGLWKFKYLPSTQIHGDSLFIRPDFDISKWATIKVPGNWELQGFAEPMYGGALKEGTGLYKTTFTISPEWKNQPVYLAFDGVQYGYDLWVNGKYTGSFASSFNRQTFDITGLIDLNGKNDLAVKVTTRSKGWDFDTNDDWSLSGIFRDVTLFTLPGTHIKDIVVKTFVESSGNSTINVSTLVEKAKFIKSDKGLKIACILTDPDGKLVKEFSVSRDFVYKSDTLTFPVTVKIDHPQLWNAETPKLYSLNILLTENEKVLQKRSLKIGIRQVSIENGIFKLNGTPIKLRGIDHHDLSPVNGKAVTEKEIRQDLELIKKANINFIRTSHYPPHHRLIEMCDSMGIYVMDEVPFGFGDKNLLDSTYLSVLYNRARATIWRDKNSPSVVVWSVGNENRITENGLKTGDYVKSLDNTRPYCFPTVGSYFNTIKDTYPKQVDILSPHYPSPKLLKEYSEMFDRPMIFSEYAHALGLDFDRMEELWEIMYKSPKLAGGAVWHFFDQGILRKSDQKVDRNKFTKVAWKDSINYYDTSDDKGSDGIVYANRIPQVDYWQVRKVYSPVKVSVDTKSVKTGKQTIKVKNINRFDFTNLSAISCRWEFMADTSVIQKGDLKLYCAPHDSVYSSVDITVPEKPAALFHYLRIKYFNKEKVQFYEKTFEFLELKAANGIEKLLSNKQSKPVLKEGNTIEFLHGTLKTDVRTGMIQLINSNGKPLILEGPFARVGRKAGLCSLVDKGKVSADSLKTGSLEPWDPYVLKNPKVRIENISPAQIKAYYSYERVGSDGEFINGTVDFQVSEAGFIEVSYDFKPSNAKGIFLETGISFLVPKIFTEFRWVGQGPYPSYPGKESLDEFGLYHLNSSDINFQGNRSGIQIAVITDKSGNGFALLGDKINLELEKTSDGLLISHNADLSGRYNKKTLPEKLIMARDVKQISGRFALIPITNNWPSVLTQLFGKPNSAVIPFTPFYHSYDQ